MQFHVHVFFCLSLVVLLSLELSTASSRQQKIGGRTHSKTKLLKVYHNHSELNQEPGSETRQRSSSSGSSIPSCQILRQIWRHFKRQSRNPKSTNEVPDNVDQWLRALGYSRAGKNRRRTNKSHAKATGMTKQQTFGRVIDGPDQLDPNIGKEERAFDVLRELTSDYRRQRSPFHFARNLQQQQVGEWQDSGDVGVERLEAVDRQRGPASVDVLREVLMAEKLPTGAAINSAIKDKSMVHIGREVFSPSEHRNRHLDSADYPRAAARPFDLLRWNLSAPADSPEHPKRKPDTQTFNGSEDSDPRDLWQSPQDLEQSSIQAELDDTFPFSSESTI